MRNKTISKILIAAGLITVVGAGAYGTSHNTNYEVAANKTIAQGKNAFEGLMNSLNQNENGETAASENNVANTKSSAVSNGISFGQAVNAEGEKLYSNVLEENIFNCDESNAVADNTAVTNLVKDDKTSLTDKLYLTSTVKRPVSLQWLNCNQNTVVKPNNNNCTNSGNNNNAGSNSQNNVGQNTPDKNENNNSGSQNNAGGQNNNNSTNDNNNINNGNNSNTNNNNNNNSNNNSTQNKPSTDNSTAGSESSYIAEIEQQIFNTVNAERAKAGLSALTYNNTMQKYARIKSKDMGDRGYFDHKNPEGQLITVQMQKDGVSYNAWGENIAYIGGMSGNSTIADKFMTNWMNSSGHRANILSTNFTSIGVGVYKIGNTYYATQEFYR